MADNRNLASTGEQAAVDFLEKKGMRVIVRNFRTRRGEVDIVAMDGGTLVFVEVKARTSIRFGDPSLAVDHRKQRRLTQAARDYLSSLGGRWPPCRFDVVSVHSDGGRITMRHIVDAF